MPIKYIQVGQAGVSNVTPSWVYIETNDTHAAVTTAGYLSGAAQEYVNTFKNNMMALVSTKTSPGIGVVPVVYILQVQNNSGVWSLIAPAVDVPVPFIVPGNIQAGLSGTAGDFISFPSTASKGSLILAAVANTGNTNTTISNAAMGQASVISIPDPGTASTSFILADSAGTQTITTGNFAVAAGTIAATTGNITAGSSGHAGTFASYPGASSKGNLQLVAVANTGNTNTVISNDAMGQASTVNIPDPANAIGQFLVGATATPFVSGNFPQNSGTAGLMVDSGVSVSSLSGAVTQLGQLQQISVTLNTAAVIAAYATPQVLIPAVAGKVAIVHSANVYTASTGNTAYATGTAPIIQYGTSVHGAGTIATGAGLVTGDIEAASSQIRTIGQAASATYTGITNTAVTFSCATAYTAGTGTNIVFTLVYELITATV